MMGKCRWCRWFDLEAARRGGTRVHAAAAVPCNVPRARIKFPALASLPIQYRQRPPPRDQLLMTCAEYGNDCEFYERRPKSRPAPKPPAPDKYSCSACGGSGAVELTGAYADALQLLRKHPGKTAAELVTLAEVGGIRATAMSNRLAWLARQGLATFERYGTLKRYQPTTTNEDTTT